MVVSQGDVWWVELPAATGSGPSFRRPVVIVQGDALNRSHLATTVCVRLTTNPRWVEAPGNLLLAARITNLQHDSVANVSQILTIDKSLLTEHVGKLRRAKVNVLLSGIDVVLGR